MYDNLSEEESKKQDSNLYKWQKVWRKNGYEKPREMYVVHKIGEFAWLSTTNRKDMFGQAQDELTNISAFFDNQIDAIKFQVETVEKIRRNQYEALDTLSKLVLNNVSIKG